MRKTSLLLTFSFLIGCQAMPTTDLSETAAEDGLPCVASKPLVVEIASGVVVINGVTVTPALSKKSFLKELGPPCRVAKGSPGSHQSDGYLYDKSHGFRFHTRPGEPEVTAMSFWRQETRWANIFDGKLIVRGKELPLRNIQSIQRQLPELDLDFDKSIDPKTARIFGKYSASIGKWSLNVGADSKTGVIHDIHVTFQSIFCSVGEKTDCIDKATGSWRSP